MEKIEKCLFTDIEVTNFYEDRRDDFFQYDIKINGKTRTLRFCNKCYNSNEKEIISFKSKISGLILNSKLGLNQETYHWKKGKDNRVNETNLRDIVLLEK